MSEEGSLYFCLFVLFLIIKTNKEVLIRASAYVKYYLSSAGLILILILFLVHYNF